VEPETLPSGGRVGAYRLLREIGRGGMGTVYLAARDDGEFRHQVAVKLVKRGMDTDLILARFRHERQILAGLDHPNIARLTTAVTDTVHALTPEYASPAQIRGDSVTTATDVYSLGVLVYELLTGRRPYATHGRQPEEIVLMAIRKDPRRRYGSVEQLSADIGRHLEGRPVAAQRDTFRYRATKFVRRNRAGWTTRARGRSTATSSRI
jgi:serine/threonine protein kinase